jgi:hypothetical protein
MEAIIFAAVFGLLGFIVGILTGYFIQEARRLYDD